MSQNVKQVSKAADVDERLAALLSNAGAVRAVASSVEGTLGPTGGYRLAKDPAKVTFLDIVEAVEGRTSTFICTEVRKNNPCLAGERRPGAEKSSETPRKWP